MKKIVVLSVVAVIIFSLLGSSAVAALTESQIHSILMLLRAFNVDESTVVDVEVALRGSATDFDGSPDYSINPPLDVTIDKYPDLFVASVGSGVYGSVACVYGTEPNPTTCKQAGDSTTTYYDHCANHNQLNEAFIQSDGKLGAYGALAPLGYVCERGKFVSIAIQPSVDVKVNGLDAPAKVPYNSIFEVSWTSTGADYCNEFGSFIPISGGGVWGSGGGSVSGVKKAYARHNTFGYVDELQIGVQCFDQSVSFQDAVVLSVDNP